jgi:ribosomal protein S27E
MLIQCNAKGCNKSSDALLDTTANEVICQECGQPIANITESMKRALKGAGQIIRSALKKAWMFNCNNCKANREVVMDKSTNKVNCKVCGNELQVHAAMKQAMSEAGKIDEE